MTERDREKALKKAARLAKASRSMRIQRLIWSRWIREESEVPEGAIPAIPDHHNQGERAGQGRTRLWYIDKTFHCKDCRRGQQWTAIEQLYYYEIEGGLAINEPTRCTTCRQRYEESRQRDIQGMKDAAERRKARGKD